MGIWMEAHERSLGGDSSLSRAPVPFPAFALTSRSHPSTDTVTPSLSFLFLMNEVRNYSIFLSSYFCISLSLSQKKKKPNMERGWGEPSP